MSLIYYEYQFIHLHILFREQFPKNPENKTEKIRRDGKLESEIKKKKREKLTSLLSKLVYVINTSFGNIEL